MQHIVTDEEVERFYRVFSEYSGSIPESRKFALADFLNNRPQVAQLRPIAEMPETVPEGCVRLFTELSEDGVTTANFTKKQYRSDTIAVDIFIQLPTPDPEAEERRQFEESMKKAFPLTSFAWSVENDGYKELDTESAWQGWKLAKKGGDK